MCFDQAVQAYNAGHFDIARQLADLAMKQDCENAKIMHLKGLIDLSQNDTVQAEFWFEQAINAHPDPLFYNSLCVAQTRQRAFSSAVASARAGLAIADHHFSYLNTSVLHFNLGLALQLDDQLEVAIASYRCAIEENPQSADAHNNLGTCVKALGGLEQAIALFHLAIERNPANLEAHSNLGHALLAAGRYAEAWPYFEHRWASLREADSPLTIKAPNLPVQRWLGQDLPTGRNRLLVFHEQGFGDTLQFCRYLPKVLARFTTVGFVCPLPLHRLLAHSFCSRWPNLKLLNGMPDNLLQWDWYCPLLSLPSAFNTEMSTIPADLPYLYADRRLTRKWASRVATLKPSGLPRIGLVWAGGHSGSIVDRQRSIPPEAMAPLLAGANAHWISLQKTDDTAKQLPSQQYPRLVDWMVESKDFADTAALIESLDLVISVDTAVAHLAAAMGKRVWLLNRYAGCWRWLRDRNDSPWYPGLQIFNQRSRGTWTEVLERVLAKLNDEDLSSS